MNRDFADKLIANLRSGNFQQTKKVLYDGHGHCCLGVAYETAGYKPKLVVYDETKVWEYPDSMLKVLDEDFQKEIGMVSPVGEFDIDGYISQYKHYVSRHSLAGLNDDGFTFDQIADIIDYFCDEL